MLKKDCLRLRELASAKNKKPGRSITQPRTNVTNLFLTSPYSPDTDPSITNAFATAAYRFGHTMIASMVKLIDVVTAAESNYRLACSRLK